MEKADQPWWADDPGLDAARNEVWEWLESAKHQPVKDDGPDPVVDDFLSGASWRELADARDDLARARARYADAVRAARAVGLSWSEIGRVLGVPKQLVHRRFRNAVCQQETRADDEQLTWED
jgi:DNA-directed RNA polymerase specialized sigma24 family protein